MAPFNNIIVPLDGSKLSAQALPAAKLMANATHAPLTLMRSFAPLPGWHTDVDHGRFSAAMAAGEHDRTLAGLTNVKQRMEHWGIESPIFVEAREGPAHEAIIGLANRDPGVLLVMSTHGRGGLTRLLTGSVTAKVVRAVGNPTLIVRCNDNDCPIVPQRIDNVIVPLDGSSFAENALPFAGDLAAAFGAGVTLFRATPGPERFRAHAQWSRSHDGVHFGGANEFGLANELSDASREYLWRMADALRARFPIFDVTVQTSQRDPSQSIVSLAEQLGNGMVVMATRGRRAVGRALFGSVGDQVVRHSPLPTLLVRGPMPAGDAFAERWAKPELADASAFHGNKALIA